MLDFLEKGHFVTFVIFVTCAFAKALQKLSPFLNAKIKKNKFQILYITNLMFAIELHRLFDFRYLCDLWVVCHPDGKCELFPCSMNRPKNGRKVKN